MKIYTYELDCGHIQERFTRPNNAIGFVTICSYLSCKKSSKITKFIGSEEIPTPLPIHRTEAGYPRCSTCDGGGCYDCTDPA